MKIVNPESAGRSSADELMRALDDQVRLGKILYPAVFDWRRGKSQKPTPPRGCATGHRSPRSSCGTTCSTAPQSANCCRWPRRLTCRSLPGGALAEGRLTGKYLNGHNTGRATQVGRPYTQVSSDDIVREVVAVSDEIGCTPAQVAISWVRQQPGPVIPLIAARTEEQFRDNLAATDVDLSQQHRDRLDALSRPTLGFPADVMRETSVVSGIYGVQLPDIDDPRAHAVRHIVTGTDLHR